MSLFNLFKNGKAEVVHDVNGNKVIKYSTKIESDKFDLIFKELENMRYYGSSALKGSIVCKVEEAIKDAIYTRFYNQIVWENIDKLVEPTICRVTDEVIAELDKVDWLSIVKDKIKDKFLEGVKK